VFNFPDQSLAFILADAGFDVWLGNWRGNTYSMQNIHYNPSDAAFWDWTWDEMAKYDLPCTLSRPVRLFDLSCILTPQCVLRAYSHPGPYLQPDWV
jgi:hypothetical protein